MLLLDSGFLCWRGSETKLAYSFQFFPSSANVEGAGLLWALGARVWGAFLVAPRAPCTSSMDKEEKNLPSSTSAFPEAVFASAFENLSNSRLWGVGLHTGWVHTLAGGIIRLRRVQSLFPLD